MAENPRPGPKHTAAARIVREMTSAELEQAGIVADYWHGGPTYFRDGQELDPHERVLLHPPIMPKES